MQNKEFFNTAFAILSTFLTYLFGGWDTCLIVLVAFIAIDYLTGIMSGAVQQKLNSHIGFKGILRKATIFLVLIVAVLLDRLLNEGTWVFRTLVSYFYIANEGISILENCGKCGIPLPQKLLKILEQLKNKDGEINENN